MRRFNLGEVSMWFKQAARTLLTGRSSRYFDDETIQFNLRNIIPTVDESCSAMRLNVLLPSLSASGAFGGLTTQVSLPVQMFAHGLEELGWKLRFISLKPAPSDDDNLAKNHMERYKVSSELVSFVSLNDGNQVPVSANDVFLGSLWFCHIWALPLLNFQFERFGSAKRPYISLVQDYEPCFHPWSSAFMLARGAYDSDWPKRIIFNSSELSEYYKRQGHKFERSVVFEPVLNYSLRDALHAEVRPNKERRILFYGRPDDRRNCFYLGRRALEIWSERYAESSRWKVISVGAKYPAFRLSKGEKVEVHGKLPLDLYISELQRAAVGLSLMASPHPSYPPLEMAHFGGLTVSNNFECKNITDWHENLFISETMSPDSLANAIIQCCERFDINNRVGINGRTHRREYLCNIPANVLRNIVNLIID
jgi:hypothetical protein